AALVLRLAAPWLAGAAIELFERALRLDAFVVVLVLALAALAGALLTLVPARILLAVRPPGTRRRGIRQVMLVTEVAGAVLLTALASLLARSELLVDRVDKGFDARGVFAARVNQPDGHFKDEATWRETYERVLAAARQLPG